MDMTQFHDFLERYLHNVLYLHHSFHLQLIKNDSQAGRNDTLVCHDVRNLLRLNQQTNSMKMVYNQRSHIKSVTQSSSFFSIFSAILIPVAIRTFFFFVNTYYIDTEILFQLG